MTVDDDDGKLDRLVAEREARIRSSAACVVLLGPDEPDAVGMLELGLMILSNKPIVLIEHPNHPTPAGLARVAHLVVPYHPDKRVLSGRVRAALAGLIR